MTSNQLTEKLTVLFADVISGKTKPVVAVEANNAAGKIIANTKNQLVFCALKGEEPSIPFLADCTTGLPAVLVRKKLHA